MSPSSPYEIRSSSSTCAGRPEPRRPATYLTSGAYVRISRSRTPLSRERRNSSQRLCVSVSPANRQRIRASVGFSSVKRPRASPSTPRARPRRRDEKAFMELVERYGPAMLRVARSFVRTAAAAEEVVQDTWLGVLRGIDRFEGRSSLKTWIFRILVNTAKTRGVREARSIPFSALAGEDEPAVEPERFFGPDHPSLPDMWASPPSEWPAERLEAKETRELIDRTIEELPPLQRQVITMRDVEGFTAEETCNALDL